MQNPSRTYLLLEERLGQDLREHVTDLRAAAESWNAIARDLNARTGVPVTPETLRVWFYDLPKGQRTGAA